MNVQFSGMQFSYLDGEKVRVKLTDDAQGNHRTRYEGISQQDGTVDFYILSKSQQQEGRQIVAADDTRAAFVLNSSSVCQPHEAELVSELISEMPLEERLKGRLQRDVEHYRVNMMG